MVHRLGAKVMVVAGSFFIKNTIVPDQAGGPNTINVDMCVVEHNFEGVIVDIDWMEDMRSPLRHTKVMDLETGQCYIFIDIVLRNNTYLIPFDGSPIL